MGQWIDLHVHTKRHSPCSDIEPECLVEQAVRAGLDGLVITEHYYQWREDDLAGLRARSPHPEFLLLAGFEYGSRQGDILIYGLAAGDAAFPRGLSARDAVARAHRLGGVCIGAHPTRAGMGFDAERIGELGLDALEVHSMNLKEHEQREAVRLARGLELPPVAASDAHELSAVGRYVTGFPEPVRTMADLRMALARGRFQVVMPAGKIGVRP